MAGHSDEGLALIPLLEANPEVEIAGILCTDRDVTLEHLKRVEPSLAERFSDRVLTDPDELLRIQGLVAVIDADPAAEIRDVLEQALDQGLQVPTPLVARLLYAFGPIKATRKSDLLQSLSEILESYNLTIDRRALLNRVLQIAVTSTGADHGSLALRAFCIFLIEFFRCFLASSSQPFGSFQSS